MSDTTFQGFDFPNTTPVPDIVFDELLRILTGNELKVLLYIIRRTYGFGKSADAISLSQFREGIKTKDEKILDLGCGLEHNRTILVALAALEKKGYIVSKKRNTTIGDKDTTIYKLRFKGTDKPTSEANPDRGVVTSGNHGVVTSGNHGSLPQVTTGSYSTSPRVVTSGNQQETVLQETVLQETVLQEDTYSADLLSQDRHTLSLSPQEMIAALQSIGFTVLPSNPQQQETSPSDTESHSHQETQALPHQGYVQSQDAHPFVHAPLQSGDLGGANNHPSSDSMTPPTTSVGNTATPRRSGTFENAQQSHHVGTQEAQNLAQCNVENALQQQIPSNEPPTPSNGTLALSQTQIEPSSSNGTSNQASYSPSQQHATQTPLASSHDSASDEPAKPKRSRKPATEKLTQPEPDLSGLNERELQAYAMLRSEDKPKYLAYSPAKRETYNNWLASYGFAVPVDITPKFDECLERIIQLHPTPEEFKNWRAAIKKRDNEKLPEKRFFKNRSPQIWDVVRDVAALREDGQSQTPSQPTPIRSVMTREEACKLAHDIVEQGKRHDYKITAKVDTSKKDATIWLVRVDWPNEDGYTIPAMKSPEQWQEKFKEMHEVFSYVPMSRRGII